MLARRLKWFVACTKECQLRNKGWKKAERGEEAKGVAMLGRIEGGVERVGRSSAHLSRGVRAVQRVGVGVARGRDEL